MPPRRSTCGHPLAYIESDATQGNTDPLVEDPIAQALNRIAEVIQHMIENTRCEEHRSVAEEDQALERFLKFHPPQHFGKPDSKHEAKTWIDQMENIFVVFNYRDLRKVQLAIFRLPGLARDW
jgi:hypothetical protein